MLGVTTPLGDAQSWPSRLATTFPFSINVGKSSHYDRGSEMMIEQFEVDQLDNIGTSYLVAMIDTSRIIGGGEAVSLKLAFDKDSGAPTKLTCYLYGKSAAPTANVHGSAPNEDYRRYTEEIELTLNYSTTHASKATASAKLDQLDLTQIGEWGPVSEVHMKLDSGQGDAKMYIGVRRYD